MKRLTEWFAKIGKAFTPPKTCHGKVILGLVIFVLAMAVVPVHKAYSDPLQGGATSYSDLNFGFTSHDIYLQPQTVRSLSSYIDSHGDSAALAVSVGTISCTGIGGPALGAMCAIGLNSQWSGFVNNLHNAAWFGVCVDIHYDASWTPIPIYTNFQTHVRGGLAWKWEPYPSYNNWHMIWERTDGGCHNDIDESNPCGHNPPPPSTPAIPYCYVF
jgi:hypothetical protein